RAGSPPWGAVSAGTAPAGPAAPGSAAGTGQAGQPDRPGQPAGSRVADLPATGRPAPGARTASASVSETDPGRVIVPEINTAIVARGDNLWRISKRVYGAGLRYTVIFGANTPQIRDPDLIYPGQVFVLPADKAGRP
ncbi:MAG: hypothetical protein JWR08_1611, partial [Enterovirga sp.]|nr:hypothetical protein [Enterovirga sp.]